MTSTWDSNCRLLRFLVPAQPREARGRTSFQAGGTERQAQLAPPTRHNHIGNTNGVTHKRDGVWNVDDWRPHASADATARHMMHVPHLSTNINWLASAISSKFLRERPASIPATWGLVVTPSLHQQSV